MNPSLQPTAYFASGSPPRWSPDGKKILATLHGKLQVQNTESGDSIALGPQNKRVTDADWSPVEDKVTYSYYDQHQGQVDKHWGVLSNSTTEQQETVFSSTGRLAKWSPDGSRVAYSLLKKEAPKRLAIMDSRGDHETVLADIGVEYLDWSPDGQQILISSREIVDSTLQVFDMESQKLKSLLPHPSRSETHGVFSPDGSKVAFERKDKVRGRTELFVFDREKQDEQKVATPPGQSFDPVWSKDGQSLVYTHKVPGGNYDLYRTQLADSEVSQLTQHEGNEYAPAFSPDGSQIAYYQSDQKAPRGQRESLQVLTMSSKQPCKGPTPKPEKDMS